MPEHNQPNPGDHAIIIVGAGPAGLSTALHLAELAPELVPQCVVLESSHHPRPKLCGGGILPDGERILSGLGLDLDEVPRCDVDWAHFDFDGRGMRLRGERQGYYAFRTIRRHEFDAWLAEKARQRGILIHEETQVTKVLPEAGGVTLHTSRGEYRARVVVGADGSNSMVRRVLPSRAGLHVARLLEVITEAQPETSFHDQADSYFDFWVVPHGIRGYTWDFPALEGGRPVRVRGVFDSNVSTRPPTLSLSAALAQELHRHGLDLDDYQLEGFPIRWFDPRGTFSAPGILLAGDAAGADALYGEGISLALGYGRLAAYAVREAFAQQDFSFRTYRSTLLRSEMGKALRWRTWLARVFYRFRFPLVQAFFWHRLGPAIEWVVRRVVIGWAERELKQHK